MCFSVLYPYSVLCCLRIRPLYSTDKSNYVIHINFLHCKEVTYNPSKTCRLKGEGMCLVFIYVLHIK